MDGAPWKILTDYEAGSYGWAIDKYGTLPEGLKPRTLLRVINPRVLGEHACILMEVRDRQDRHWTMSPMFFEPLLTYEDSAGNRYPEYHPRAIAMLQKEIRKLEREAVRQEKFLADTRAQIDNLTWRSTRKSPGPPSKER